MNLITLLSYKSLMRKFTLVFFLLIMSTQARADIKAVWTEKNIKTNLESIERDGIKYISITDLAIFLQSNSFDDLRKGTGTLLLKNGGLDYTLFSPYVIVGDKSYNIHHNVILYKGRFYAPVKYLVPIIDKFIPDDLLYSKDENSIGLFPALYNINDLTAQQKMNGLLIEVFLSELLKYDAVKTNDNWLILTMYNGTIDTSKFNGRRPDKAVYDTKAYQFENSAQLSIRLRPRDFTFVSKIKENPLRIQMMVKGEGFADTVLSYNPETNGFKDNLIDVIVIDPGHGGDDEGAIGPSGVKEKDVNLEISKRLKRLLENKNFKVILTRDSDRFVSLSDRTKIANEAGADIFVSIHANASKNNRKARGFISFFLSDAKTDQARATAALENASIRFESSENQKDYVSDLDFILLDMVQSEFLKESADLAAMIEQNIQKHSKISSRGVDQAGFFVLNKAYMPSVLLETAFISNKKDEKLLKNKKTHENIARAITESILQFKEKYEALR